MSTAYICIYVAQPCSESCRTKQASELLSSLPLWIYVLFMKRQGFSSGGSLLFLQQFPWYLFFNILSISQRHFYMSTIGVLVSLVGFKTIFFKYQCSFYCMQSNYFTPSSYFLPYYTVQQEHLHPVTFLTYLVNHSLRSSFPFPPI